MQNADTVTPCRCGQTYTALRTGVSFREVASWLWVGSSDRTTWRQKTRHTVLGRWHQAKLELWQAHVEACALGNTVEGDQDLSSNTAESDQEGSWAWRALPWVAAAGGMISVFS